MLLSSQVNRAALSAVRLFSQAKTLLKRTPPPHLALHTYTEGDKTEGFFSGSLWKVESRMVIHLFEWEGGRNKVNVAIWRGKD